MKSFPANISAILFDHDGTLVDTVPGLVAGHNAVAKHFGHPPLTREDVVVRMASGGGLKIMGDLYGAERAEEALALFRQLVGGERKKNITPMKGMERMLAKLSELQAPMAIVSNANKDMLDHEVGHLALGKYFPVVVGADEAPKNKPAADPLFLALERLKLPKETIATTLMVGDSEADLAAAKAAGCHAIYIHESGKAPEGYAPLAVFRSCEEFADFLDSAGPSAKPKTGGPTLA
ncbi:MAG: HAD family hydrolase [Alphaproteobacteria bacterium]